MLPGIRFVLATMLLTVSLAICGLGATALLRAAQQDSAELPALQALRDPFPPSLNTTPPTLAVMQVDSPAPIAPTSESDQSDNNDSVVATTADSAAPATTSPPDRLASDATTQSTATETEPPVAVATMPEEKTPEDTSPQVEPAATASTDGTVETSAIVEQNAPPPTASADAAPVTGAAPEDKIEASNPAAIPHDQIATSSTVTPDGQTAPTASSAEPLTGNDIATGSIDPKAATKRPSAKPVKAKKARIVRRVRARRVTQASMVRQQAPAKQAVGPLGF